MKRRGNDWVHNHDDSVNTQRVRETTPKENQPLFDLDERDARKGLSPKSLNRRECTPRKKRMQEIFDVPHENFLSRDYFLHELLTPSMPSLLPIRFRIDRGAHRGLDRVRLL